jgi:hypothetical protein
MVDMRREVQAVWVGIGEDNLHYACLVDTEGGEMQVIKDDRTGLWSSTVYKSPADELFQTEGLVDVRGLVNRLMGYEEE